MAVDCGDVNGEMSTQIWMELPANVLRCRAAIKDGLANEDYRSDVDAAVTLLNQMWDQCNAHFLQRLLMNRL